MRLVAESLLYVKRLIINNCFVLGLHVDQSLMSSRLGRFTE